MKDENLPEERKISADDVKFMRAVVEKSYRQAKPDAHVIVMWGVICTVAYAAAHFLVTPQGCKWMWPVYLTLMTIGLCYTFITLFLINKREKKAGFIPHQKKQIIWVWLFMALHVLTWSVLGMLFSNFSGGDPGFLGAMGLSIALSVTGVLHSREWLFGGALIFAGMVLTYFIKDYGYIILGLVTGVGLIVPAIVVHRNFLKGEKENEQA